MQEIRNVINRPWPLFAANLLKVEEVLEMVGPGWRPLVKRLVEDLFTLGWDGSLHQIKEKFGGLRFYVGAETEEMWRRIGEAEKESERTCENCGEPGTLGPGRGWWRTLCKKCGEGA